MIILSILKKKMLYMISDKVKVIHQVKRRRISKERISSKDCSSTEVRRLGIPRVNFQLRYYDLS